MPLTELQLPNKAEFYRQIQSLANSLASLEVRLEQFEQFVDSNKMTVADLDAMGVPAGDIRTHLAAFRAAAINIRAAIVAEKTDIDNVRSIITL